MKITKKHLSSLMLATLLGGCGGGSEGNGGNVTPATPLNLTSVISLPQTIASDADGVMEIKLSNPVTLSSIVGAGTVSDNTMIITGLSDQTNKTGNASVEFTLDQTAQVGANKACWNGVVGAHLNPGESCSQFIAVSGSDNSSITGNLIFSAKSNSGDISSKIAIDTHFVPADQLALTSAVSSSKAASIRPNAQTEFILNNTADSAINGTYIDLTQLPDALINAIDWNTLAGGIYYEKKKRIIVPNIPAAGSQKITFFVKGQASEVLKDANLLSSLENNGALEINELYVGSATAANKVAPALTASDKPFDMSNKAVSISKGNNDSIILTIPSNAGKLRFNSLEFSVDHPQYISIISSVGSGDQVLPGDSIEFKVSAAKNAISGEYPFNAILSDSSGHMYSVNLTALIDASTQLSVEEDNPVVLRSNSSTNAKASYLNIVNKGKYIAYLADKLSDQFSVAGGDLKIVDSPMNSCKGAQLLPGNSCQIGIQSSNKDAALGTYKLNAIAKNNVKSATIAMIDLQASPEGANVIMMQSLPARVAPGNQGLMSFKIANPGETILTISAVDFSDVHSDGASWDCGDLKAGEIIEPGKTKVYQCRVTATEGVSVNGILRLAFNNDSVIYATPAFNTQFVASSTLDTSLQSLNGINVDASTGLDVVIDNQGSVRAQNITLDLSKLDAAIYQSFSGNGYNPDTGILTLSGDLLPKAHKHIHLDFALTSDNLNALKNAQVALNQNVTNKIIALKSNNHATIYPAVSVSTSIVHFEPSSVSYIAPGQKYLKLTNPTSKLVTFTISDLPLGIQADKLSGEIMPDADQIITLTAAQEVPNGQHTMKVSLNVEGLEGNVYESDISLNIASASLTAKSASGYIIMHLPKTQGETSTTDVILSNSDDGIANNSFSIFGITSVADAFEVRDAQGNVVSSDKIEITDSTKGNSVTKGVADGAQATIALIAHDKDLPSGNYVLMSKKVGNLQEAPVGSILLNPALDNMLMTPKSLIPQTILIGKTALAQAEFTNINTHSIKLVNVTAPAGALFDTSAPMVNGNLWDGSQGVTLQPGEKATLQFNVTLSDLSAEFKGELKFEIEDLETQNLMTETIMQFDTTAVDSQKSMDFEQGNVTVDFIPDNTSVLSFSSTTGLNNAYVDFSNMPDELYQEIAFVKFNGNKLVLPEQPGKIMLSYQAPNQKARLDIALKSSAAEALTMYKDNLADNTNSHYLALGAANSDVTHPAIFVANQAISVSPVTIATEQHTITFTNQTSQALELVQAQLDDTLYGISIQSNQCTGVLAAKQSCNITLHADKDA
ncbi:hypothetical protein [Caedibacter taeniospiralis]|uniref:hypothetical protein n=1 Tax=Caedibacter taeniospiralis TaxID=28907 RepID=UPI000C2732BF|nr:hypothetical protein [Caedibacter taeniospiralis]